MHTTNQRGNVLTYVIVAMAMAATLAVGIVYMNSSSTLGMGEVSANNLNRAYFLALAGKDFVLMTPPGPARLSLNGRVYSLCRNNSCPCIGASCSNRDKFSLIVTCDGGTNTYTIDSVGIVNDGTPFEARRKIHFTKVDSCT